MILILTLSGAAAAAYAQSPASAAAAPTTADATPARLSRARALAASHNLAAAASELDAIINSTKDDSMRDIARIMLMGVFLEEANYTKADALLVETFNARSPQKESTISSYFALAGQTLNGARAHMERYRSFGINIADSGLPPEAVNDLDRLRVLLERVAEQAKEINSEGAKRSDASALWEDAAGVRSALARNEQDRLQWQREIASARESLATAETRIGSTGRTAMRQSTSNAGAQSSANNPAMARTTAPSPVMPAHTTVPAKTQSNAQGNTAVARASAAAPAPSGSDTTAGKQNANNTTTAQPLSVGSLIEKATHKVSPQYPAPAKTARITGVVKVYLEVDENGSVVSVGHSDGPLMLRQAAVEAARRWKFQPTMVDGQPVRVTGYINFNFTL